MKLGLPLQIMPPTISLALFLAVANSASAQGILGSRQVATRRLPPVRMDSFVRQAGAMAESIYGDEGVGGTEKSRSGGGGRLPPIDGFSQENRIDSGIFGDRDEGLTTGHGAYLPSAWGADEYLGEEWAATGPSHFEIFQTEKYRKFEGRQLESNGAVESSEILHEYDGY